MTDQTERVAPGTLVEIKLVDKAGGTEIISFSIVPNELADFKNGFLGEGTPLARAILGQRAGATISYGADSIVAIQIVSIKPAQSKPDQGVIGRRKETLRKAVLRSDLTNALIFATSFDSKWGDYDPSGLVEELEDQAKDAPPDNETD